MKKQWSRVTAAAAGLVLAGQLALCARAAQTHTFLQRYDTAPGQLIVYGRDLEGAGAEQLEASLSGQELQVVSVSTTGRQELPLTLYCLVDISGSMDSGQMEQAKQALRSMAGALEEGDQMVIATLGNSLSKSDFLSGADQMEQAIDALVPIRTEDTNLYAGIVESLSVLNSDTRVGPRSCLVILSDGDDDQTSGITQKEAEEKVLASGVPVYTVATLRTGSTQAQQEHAKLLGSFARMSVGGAHFAPALDETTPEQAGQAIVEKMEQGLVLTLDTSGVDPQKDELLLSVCYSAGNTEMTDVLTVYARDLQAAPAEPEASSGAGSDPADTPEPEKEGFPVLAAAGGAAVLAAALILIQKRRRDKAAEARALAEAKAAEEARAAEEEAAKARAAEEALAREKARAEEQARSAPPEPAVVYRVRLDAIGYQEICRRITLPEGKEQTLGRTGKADILLDEEDRRLSGCHCSMTCTGGVLTVKDLNSTNGTFVNGVPIRQLGPTIVPNGATVRMGSYEYRVEIQRDDPHGANQPAASPVQEEGQEC